MNAAKAIKPGLFYAPKYFIFLYIYCSQPPDAHENTPLISPDGGPQRSQNGSAQTAVQQIMAINPCVFAFNLAIVLSISLIILEILCYKYDLQFHNHLLIPFYVTRLIYYSLLLAVTTAGVWLVMDKISTEVRYVSLFNS